MKERKRALQAKATVWLAPPPVSCLPALADPGPGPALTPAVFSCPLPQLSCPPSLLFLLSLSLLYPSTSPLAESFSHSPTHLIVSLTSFLAGFSLASSTLSPKLITSSFFHHTSRNPKPVLAFIWASAYLIVHDGASVHYFAKSIYSSVFTRFRRVKVRV